MDLIGKAAAFIKEWNMIGEGDTVIAGVSGGADSVCLLHCLLALRPEMGFHLHAVHIHHGIRGEEADLDEAFVKNLCEEKDIPYRAFFVDAPLYAKEHKKTEEEAGRILRREAFCAYIKELEESAGSSGRYRIALAHHMDDIAETVLFQLSRGTGLAGTAGIRPVNTIAADEEGMQEVIPVIRPLLCVSRTEIDAWLAENGIAFRTDRTNLEDEYARNRIRHHVIPYLENNIHAGAARHIAESAFLAGEALDFIEGEAGKRLEQYASEKEKPEKYIFLSEEAAAKETPFMLSYIIRAALKRIAPHQQDITRQHIFEIGALFKKNVGKQICLPGGIRAERKYDGIAFSAENENAAARAETVFSPLAETELAAGCSVRCGKWKITAEEDEKAALPIPENTYTKWIDFAIIADRLCVRTRKQGDYLVVRADGAKKSLKSYMIDARIPKEMRDEIPVVADGQEIIWVVGHRLSERYKITESTKRIIRLSAEWIGEEISTKEHT